MAYAFRQALPGNVETWRKYISDLTDVTITFENIHVSIPIVTITLEGGDTGGEANTYISNINKKQVTFGISHSFTGYAHIHVISTQ